MAWRRRERRSADAQAERAEQQQVVRDAEESLVAALQESDTAVEAITDSEADGLGDTGRSRRRWTIGVAGTLLAALGIVVARRRR